MSRFAASTKHKRLRLITAESALILLVSGIVLLFPFAPVAHASGPTVVNTIGFGATASPVTSITTSALSVTGGNLLVMGVSWCCIAASTITFSDSGGNSWNVATGPNTETTDHLFNEILYATARSTVSDQFTATVSTSSNTRLSIEGAQVNGAAFFVNATTANCLAGCTTPWGTATTAYPTGGVFVFGLGWQSITTISSTAGFTALDCSNACLDHQLVLAEYKTDTIASSTQFAFTGAGSAFRWLDSGAIFGTVNPNQLITVIGACTFTQLQCWAYPLMFLGMFMSFFIGAGAAFEVSEKGMIYLIFAGATAGSLVEIQMGIMTPMLPLMLIAGNIAYSFRLDRIIGNAVRRGPQNETQ